MKAFYHFVHLVVRFQAEKSNCQSFITFSNRKLFFFVLSDKAFSQKPGLAFRTLDFTDDLFVVFLVYLARIHYSLKKL